MESERDHVSPQITTISRTKSSHITEEPERERKRDVEERKRKRGKIEKRFPCGR
jgi:hypothetical protein